MRAHYLQEQQATALIVIICTVSAPRRAAHSTRSKLGVAATGGPPAPVQPQARVLVQAAAVEPAATRGGPPAPVQPQARVLVQAAAVEPAATRGWWAAVEARSKLGRVELGVELGRARR